MTREVDGHSDPSTQRWSQGSLTTTERPPLSFHYLQEHLSSK